MTIEERVYQVAAAVFDAPVEQLSAATSPGSVEQWDSLNHLQLLMALESEFGVSFTMDEATELDSLGRIVEALESRERSAA